MCLQPVQGLSFITEVESEPEFHGHPLPATLAAGGSSGYPTTQPQSMLLAQSSWFAKTFTRMLLWSQKWRHYCVGDQ